MAAASLQESVARVLCKISLESSTDSSHSRFLIDGQFPTQSRHSSVRHPDLRFNGRGYVGSNSFYESRSDFGAVGTARKITSPLGTWTTRTSSPKGLGTHLAAIATAWDGSLNNCRIPDRGRSRLMTGWLLSMR